MAFTDLILSQQLAEKPSVHAVRNSPSATVQLTDLTIQAAGSWASVPDIVTSTQSKRSRWLVVNTSQSVEVAFVGEGQAPGDVVTLPITVPVGSVASVGWWIGETITGIYVRLQA